MSLAATRVRQQLRELAARPAGEPLPSPCNSVCRVRESTGLCEGCLRTVDEIAAWRQLDEDGKREVWQRLAARAGVRAEREQR